MVVNTTQSWYDYRTLSPKQRLACDFAMKRGRFRTIGGRRRYVGYGGAGWGGKSYLLRSLGFAICMDLRSQGFPDQWNTIYTRTYPDLEDRHIRKLSNEFAGIGTFSDSNRYGLHIKWHGEGLGGTFFRNVESSDSSGRGGGKKPGAESIAALIDEPTEMDYEDFTGINYVTRPSSASIPYIATVCGMNPDGRGHKWVKEIFHPKYRKLTRQFFKGKGAAKPEDILFIQARKEDNPAYEEQKDVVDAIFSMIEDEDIRRAREEGSWDLYAGGRFSMWRDEVHTFEWEDLFDHYGIPFEMSPLEFIQESHLFGFTAWTSLDYGTSLDSVSAYLLHLVGPDNHVWTVARLSMRGLELEEQAEKIWEFEEKGGFYREDGPRIVQRIADPSLWGRDKRKDQFTRAERFRRTPQKLVFYPGVNDRVEGAATCAFMLGWRKGVDGGVATWPRWRIHGGEPGWEGCPELCEMIPELPRDPLNIEDVDPRDGINHWYDSARYFLHTRFRGGRAQEKTLLRPGTPAWFREVARLQRQGKAPGDYL